MESPGSLAWRQLAREPRRLLVAVLGVAFAVLLMLMQLGFRDALFASTVLIHDRLNADLVLVGPESAFIGTTRPFTQRRLYQAEEAPGVASATGLLVGYTPHGFRNPVNDVVRSIYVLAFDLAARPLDIPAVNDQLPKLKMPDTALFDSLSRPEYGPVAELYRRSGPLSTEVNRRKVTIVGLFEIGTSFGIDGTLVTSEANFFRILPARTPGLYDLGLVLLEPGADPEAVRRDLASRLPRDVVVRTRAEYAAQERAYWNSATPIGFIFAFGSLMGFIVGSVVVYQILFADVSDHLPEYATLKALGYSNGYLARVVLAEAALLAVAGYLPGAVASAELYRLTRSATHLPMELSAGVALEVLAFTVVMCVLAGLLALRRIRSADPAEVF